MTGAVKIPVRDVKSSQAWIYEEKMFRFGSNTPLTLGVTDAAVLNSEHGLEAPRRALVVFQPS